MPHALARQVVALLGGRGGKALLARQAEGEEALNVRGA